MVKYPFTFYVHQCIQSRPQNALEGVLSCQHSFPCNLFCHKKNSFGVCHVRLPQLMLEIRPALPGCSVCCKTQSRAETLQALILSTSHFRYTCTWDIFPTVLIPAGSLFYCSSTITSAGHALLLCLLHGNVHLLSLALPLVLHTSALGSQCMRTHQPKIPCQDWAPEQLYKDVAGHE